MWKVCHLVVMLLVTVCWVFPAGALTTFELTFDDLATPNDKGMWGVVPDDYQGFFWKDVEVVNVKAYQNYFGNTKIAFPSKPNAAYNGGLDGGYEVVAMAAAQPFVLEGAYFATWAQNNNFVSYGSKELTVTGYLAGNPVGSSTFALTPEFVWQDVKLGPIDLVTFRHVEKDNAHWWLMDNVKGAFVPLPTTLGLFGLGLITLLCFGRRHKRD